MSNPHQALTFVTKMLKIPPRNALWFFNSSTHNVQHTHQSISVTINLLLASKMLHHAQSLLLQIISGRISSSFFTPSSLLQHLTQPDSYPNATNLVQIYETIINAHVRSQALEESLFYFNQMLDKNLVPGSHTFNNLLHFLLCRNDFDRSWLFFNENRGRVDLDEYSFGIMIKGCCDSSEPNGLTKGFELLSQLEETGWPGNVVIYTTLIDGCCKNGDIEKAKELFSKMGKMGLVANQHTYTVLINGFFKNSLNGFELFEEMRINGVEPNLYTYNCLINQLCKNGETSKAFKLFDEMSERGVVCNVVTYNTLVSGLCSDNKPVEAERLVHKMNRVGITSNMITYNTLIDGFCNAGRIEKALCLFNRLKSLGLSPTLVTYNVLIAGLSKTGNSTRVIELVKEMEEERGVNPSRVTYTILIDMYLRSGDMERAYRIYSSMDGKTGLVRDVYTYGVLIRGLCMKGKMKEALEVFESMREVKLEPNEVIYNTMIHWYCKEGNSYRALRMIKEMMMGEKCLAPNVASFGSTIGVLYKDRKWKEAEDLVCKMKELGFEPSLSVCNMISKARKELL